MDLVKADLECRGTILKFEIFIDFSSIWQSGVKLVRRCPLVDGRLQNLLFR